MSGLELILPVVFGGVAAGAQVTTALQGMRKPPVQVSSGLLSCPAFGKPR
jgi:hypothetical protein